MKGRHMMMGQTEGDREKRRAPRRHPMQVTGEPPLPYDPPVLSSPPAGRSADRIYTQPNQDYPDDTDLCFERGTSVTMVRVTPADQEKLWAALGLLPVPAAPDRVQAVLEDLQRETTHAGDLAAVHRVMKMLRGRA